MTVFICIMDFVINCVEYFGKSVTSVISAEKAFIWNSGSNIGALCLIYLLPVFVVLPFADSFIIEKEQNMLPVLLYKTGAKKYYFSKITAVAVSAFVIVALPMLINFILCLTAFPLEVNDYTNVSADQSWYYSDYRLSSMLFPVLSIKHPYIMNLLSIAATGVFCSLSAAVVCQLSFFFSASRVLVLATFFIVNHLISLAGKLLPLGNLSCSVVFYNLILGNYEGGKQLWYFSFLFIAPAVLIAVLTVPCLNRIKKIWG